MKKAPERSGAWINFWMCAQSGGDSACLLLHDLRFGAEPVVQLVAVLPAACLVEFLRAYTDLVFEFLWFAGHGRWLFLRDLHSMAGHLLGGKRTPEPFIGQLPKIGAVKAACFRWKGKSLRSWAEAFDVWRSLLGDAGFGCGLHLGLWCGRLLDLHWLSGRGLFFAGAGCCCFSCSSPDACGFLRLFVRPLDAYASPQPSCPQRATCELKRLFSQLPGDARHCVSELRLPSVLRSCAWDSCFLRPVLVAPH